MDKVSSFLQEMVQKKIAEDSIWKKLHVRSLEGEF